jgi:maltose/moltooligosaccharide transporter
MHTPSTVVVRSDVCHPLVKEKGEEMVIEKPRQGFWGLWNISFGFFGIQVAFGLQSSNMSRVFQTLGADLDKLAFLFIAGPVTGLIVQPLIGHFSDKSWGRFGRRHPYFLTGAVLAALSMIGLPNANLLLIAALFLWLLDASLNISMEPFRAFVGDMVGDGERTKGYAFQTAFIGAGAVVGSLAPNVFTWLGVANVAPDHVIPPSVRYAFYLAAFAIFSAVLWTVIRTKEYTPDELASFGSTAPANAAPAALAAPGGGVLWAGAGLILVGLVAHFGLDKQLYILGGGLVAFGAMQIINAASGAKLGAVSHILSDLHQMPDVMKRLAVAQFFSWIALFIMWIYTTPVVTQYVYDTIDTASPAYNEGANWVGILSSVYNGVAALAAFALPALARRFGASRTHMICLFAGALGYAGFLFIRSPTMLILPEIGIGIAWASILTMPYVILSASLRQDKLGIYMGIFNFFIVLPQLLIATIMGGIITSFFPKEPIWTMLVAAIVMGIAALSMVRVKDAHG